MNIVMDTKEKHIYELSLSMQAIDKESVKLLSGLEPYDALADSVANSVESETWIVDDKVMAISGISQITFLTPWACPWLLCSEEVVKYPKLFMQTSKVWVDEKVREYKHLINFVYAKHDRSIRWLKWLGFTLHEPKPMGPQGALFMMNEKKYGPSNS